jgi:ABC-type amino acid transport substrate-binding protein
VSRKILFTAQLVLVILAISLSGYKSRAQEVYIIGVEDIDYLPYYESANGQYAGFARELLDDFAAEQGIHFEYQPLPINRLYRDFFSQKIDFKFPDNPDWAVSRRKQYNLAYSYLFLPVSDGLFVRAEQSNMTIDELRSITSVLGFYPNLGFEDKIKDQTIGLEKSYDVDGALKQVISGRTDGAFMNIAVARYHLARMNEPETLKLAERLPTRDSAYALGTIKYPELVKAFDLYLVKKQQTVDALAEKYGLRWNKPQSD